MLDGGRTGTVHSDSSFLTCISFVRTGRRGRRISRQECIGLSILLGVVLWLVGHGDEGDGGERVG